MHRSQQAGLPDRGHRIGGHHDVGLDRDLDVGMPVRRPVILPTLPTTTSLIMTGEFDSSVATFGDLDVVGDRIRIPCPTAPGSGSEFRPWKAATGQRQRKARSDDEPIASHDSSESCSRPALRAGGTPTRARRES